MTAKYYISSMLFLLLSSCEEKPLLVTPQFENNPDALMTFNELTDFGETLPSGHELARAVSHPGRIDQDCTNPTARVNSRNPTSAPMPLTYVPLTLPDAQCRNELQEARQKTSNPIVVVLFDGLGTNEFGSKLLQKDVGEEIERRCSGEHITFVNFHYGKAGARKALSCLKSFENAFGSAASFHTIGHSYGAGKGVMNLLDISQGMLKFQNAITFDPRGDSYRYKNPGMPVVENFINIYQTIPLAGRPVENANFQLNAGASGHVSLPKKLGHQALAQTVGRLSCAKQ